LGRYADLKDPDLSDAKQSAHKLLADSVIYYQGEPVGTVASLDRNAPAENYAECFVRDFVPSALFYLQDGKPDIVRNFLSLTLQTRDMQEELEGHRHLPRVMPASFKVTEDENGNETLSVDFGDRAIGRVAPVDSMMWWLLLLQAYVSKTGDTEFMVQDQVQRGIRMIVNIFLQDRFEVFPTLLVPDGSFMIDRRMGVYGHPLEIQALFFGALNAARFLLDKDNEHHRYLSDALDKRLQALVEYVRHYYWVDFARLNEIHRYETEIFGHESENILNIYPDSVPTWVLEWLPEDAGYLVGNLGPGRMDFRFFSFGNLLAIIFGLATPEQSDRILDVFEGRWDDLIGRMPVKILYPALEGPEWSLLTGSDPKNVPWSYHNGGNWPALLWAFVAAALRRGRRSLAGKAFELAEHRLSYNSWPEYFDGINGRLIGRRANFQQVWSATSFLLADMVLKNPDSMMELGWSRQQEE
jgi:glycogen debranching enzyme